MKNYVKIVLGILTISAISFMNIRLSSTSANSELSISDLEKQSLAICSETYEGEDGCNTWVCCNEDVVGNCEWGTSSGVYYYDDPTYYSIGC